MLKLKLSVILTLLITIYVPKLFAQDLLTPYQHFKKFEARDTSKLFFRFENLNFVKNNEFDGDMIDGATWIGYMATPKFIYYPSSNFRIEAGARLQKYSGRENFTESEPIFSAIYNASDKLQLILGSLDQDNNHMLSQPIFKSERYFIDNAENGFQMKYKSRRLKLDTWINWEQFILEDDPFQEHFTYGLSGNWQFNNLSSQNSWSIPFEYLAIHKGGEIDASDLPVQTITNMAIGLQFTRKTENSRITSWTIRAMSYSYSDDSSESQLAFTEGHAFYPQLEITTKKSKLSVGYWSAYKYIAPKGLEFFQSVSYKEPDLNFERRDLATMNYYYQQKITKGIDFGGKVDLYMDLRENKVGLVSAIFLRINGDFFLKKLKWNP
jgi:hypothetical protein